MVERRLKEALKDDRARIQVGHISHFGLMEMSRQRLRPSLEETTLIVCPHCNGIGHVRGTESAALHVLRGVEEEAGKRRSAEIVVHVAMAIALYILNHKRERLNEIERRYGMRVIIAADDSLISPRFRIERLRTLAPGEEPRFVTPDAPRSAVVGGPIAGARAPEPAEADDEDDDVSESETEDADEAVAADGTAVEDTEESREAERRRRRRRRRRRGGREDDVRTQDAVADAGPDASSAASSDASSDANSPGEPAGEPAAPVERTHAVPEPVSERMAGDDEAARRRSRRGRRRRGGDGDVSPHGSPHGAPGAEQPDLVPVYAGPTPADPFGSGHVFDIFDVMEQAELNAAPPNRPPPGRRGSGSRSRWQPPHWAVASHPPMLVGEGGTADRPERGPTAENWALPSRPFMLRRDRHAPRWGQHRAATPAPAAPTEPEVHEASPKPRPVPIEAGPPPAPEPLRSPARELVGPELVGPELVGPELVEAASTGEPADRPFEPRLAELSAAADSAAAPPPEPPPVPANDVVAGPVVQPIVIGSESSPPLERKRGWWRRR